MAGHKRGFAHLKSVTEDATLEWTIDNFLAWSESKEKGSAEFSPIFRFFFPSFGKNFSFCIRIYPNGPKGKEGDDIGVFLMNKNKMDLTLKMSMQFLNQEKEVCRSAKTDRKFLAGNGFGWPSFLPRKWLQDSASKVLPGGALTIRCEFKVPVSESSDVTYDESRPAKHSKLNASFLTKLMADKDFADFKIICQEETYDCHKSILAARSKVFHAMLNTAESKEVKSGALIVKDFEASSVSEMLKFCYTGELAEDDDVPRLIELLLLGDMYDIADLVGCCETRLATSVCMDNCLAILDVAHKISSKVLLKIYGRFVARNFAQIKGTEKWVKLTKANPSVSAVVLEEIA